MKDATSAQASHQARMDEPPQFLPAFKADAQDG